MIRNFSLEYWVDDNWYVGRLKEIPGVFSQGETIEELEENIKDAYHMMMEDEVIEPKKDVKIKEIGVEVWKEVILSGLPVCLFTGLGKRKNEISRKAAEVAKLTRFKKQFMIKV